MSSMEELQMMENFSRVNTMADRWNIMYSDQNRSPIYTVEHYISYLRKHVSETGYARTAGSNSSTGFRPKPKPRSINKESISPVSYFLRKLKLDLKMAYVDFVMEFVKAPNNGLRLLLSLLKNLQALSVGSLPRSEGKGTLRMEEYKRNMIDEHDCLLCIKYSLRLMNATDELLEDNSGLLNVTTCLLSNFSKSRITALEILTLIITGPSSVDKILDAFTSIRLLYAEGTRFKMLASIMQTRGVSHVLFQVNCLRLLNNMLNMCKSSNMRVFLQYELEEAGLTLECIQMNSEGVGLEFDDLRKEISEWKARYIDVDSLLRKVKSDLKKEFRSDGLSEFYFDQKYGNKINRDMNDMTLTDLTWVTPHEQGYMIDYDKWIHYVQSKQKGDHGSTEESPDKFLRRDIYVPDSARPIKTISSQSQLTDDMIPSPCHPPQAELKFGHHHESEDPSYDVISVSTSVCDSDMTLNNVEDVVDEIASQKDESGYSLNEGNNHSTFTKIPSGPQSPQQAYHANGVKEKNWTLKTSTENVGDMLKTSEVTLSKIAQSSRENVLERIDLHDSGVSVNYREQDSQGPSGIRLTTHKLESYSHIFYTGSDSDKDPYQASIESKLNTKEPSAKTKNLKSQAIDNSNNQTQYVYAITTPISDRHINVRSEHSGQQNYKSAFESCHRSERKTTDQANSSQSPKNFRPIPASRMRTPSPDYIIDETSMAPPLKTSTTRSKPVIKRPETPSAQPKTEMTNGDTPVKSPNGNYPRARSKLPTQSNTAYSNTSPDRNSWRQNNFNKNSPGNVAMKQAMFEDKKVFNVNSLNHSGSRNSPSLKKISQNLINEPQSYKPQSQSYMSQPHSHTSPSQSHKLLHHSHSPQPQSRMPQPQSHSPQPQSRMPQPHSHTPQSHSHQPPPQSHMSQPDSHSPQLQSRTPQPHIHSPQPQNRMPQPHSHTPQYESHMPQPDSQSPQPQSRMPQTDSRTSPSQSHKLLHHSHTPHPQSHLPQPDSQSPQPQSRMPQPHNHSPNPQSHMPQPDSQSPQPQSRMPQPHNHSPNPQSHIMPQPDSQSPQPQSRMPQPYSHTPQPQSHMPQPDSQSPQPQSRMPQPYSHTPQPQSHMLQPHSHKSQPQSHMPQLHNHSPQPQSHSNTPQNHMPQKVAKEREDGGEKYTNEINKILDGLDHTLEQHGWKDTIKLTHTTKVPFEAYI